MAESGPRPGWPRAIRLGVGLLVAAWLAPGLLRAGPAAPTVNVIPRPSTVEAEDSRPVAVRAGTAVVAPPGDRRALWIARWLADLTLRGRGLRLVPTAAAGGAQAGAVVAFERRPGPASGEAYAIDIAHGRIAIRASSDAGLLYGAATLWQMMTADGGRGAVSLPSVHIEDQPRFAWRGVLLDSARHLQSPAFIERMIDAMALHKLNVLQWHLTDDQGWRLQIKRYPRLTRIGAWRAPADDGKGKAAPYGGFYTQDEVRTIVAYATARNVTIVPEIEMPGHAVAALLAYPALSAGPAPPRAIQGDWGIFPYAFGAGDNVFDFLDGVLAEVVDLFPGRFIGIGGDEVPLEIWKSSPKVQARMKALGIADEASLQNYFIRRIDTFLAAHGRRMIGWEEILQGGTLPADAAITSWRGAQSALTAARAGHDVVLATAPTLYFDNRQSDLPSEPPGRGWVVSLHDVYAFDPGDPPLAPPLPPPATSAPPASVAISPPPASPAPAAPQPAFTDADRAHILGLQGNLWTEHIRTPARLEAMMFPRLAAVAEAGWSRQSDRDWGDFLARLPAEFARFARLGLNEDESAFAIDLKAAPDGDGFARVTLSNQTTYGQIRYTLGGAAPLSDSEAYVAPIRVALPARLRAASFISGRAISPVLDQALDAPSLLRRSSQELDLCAGKLPLNMEGQSPTRGPRPVYLIQVMDACWIWPGVDLTDIAALKVGVGRIPFNLQLGPERDKIVVRPASTPQGELQVRLDSCSGELLATLPLAPATRHRGVTALSAPLPPRAGVHSLCFAFTAARLDPMWAISQVQLIARGGTGKAH